MMDRKEWREYFDDDVYAMRAKVKELEADVRFIDRDIQALTDAIWQLEPLGQDKLDKWNNAVSGKAAK